MLTFFIFTIFLCSLGIFPAILVIIRTPAKRRQIAAIYHDAASKEIEMASIIARSTLAFICHSFEL